MDPPPPYLIRTVYDETHRGKWFPELSIDSMGNSPNLVGSLEHHNPETDGSFAICIAGGSGAFVSKALLDSIPASHRPELSRRDAGSPVTFSVMGSTAESLGSVMLPIILTKAGTNEHIRIILYASVVPNLLIPVFIGRRSLMTAGNVTERWDSDGPTFTFHFSPEEFTVKGI